jgi:hypothetical protein
VLSGSLPDCGGCNQCDGRHRSQSISSPLLPPPPCAPAQAIAGLDLGRLQAALLLDSAPNAASSAREQRQEGRQQAPAPLALALHEPAAAAALLLLRGAALVSVNTCPTSAWTTGRRLGALLEGLARGSGADVVRALWAANGQVVPELSCGRRSQVVYGPPVMASVPGSSGRGRGRLLLGKKK